MKYWLAMAGLAAAFAATAQAQPMRLDPAPAVKADEAQQSALKFRFVADATTDPRPVRNSGMIVHTEVAPQTSLGIGLFNTTPKKPGGGDYRIDGRTPKSRKVGVSLRVKF
jgi:hypothetical protein